MISSSMGECSTSVVVLKYEHRLLSGKIIFRRDKGTFDHIVENAEAMLKVLRWDEIEAPSDRKSTRLNSSHQIISYAVFCLKKKKQSTNRQLILCRPDPIRKHNPTGSPGCRTSVLSCSSPVWVRIR